MGKSVVIISASPRKDGNTDILCGEFARGAKAGGHKTETVFLRDRKIAFCVACDVCRNNGGTCARKDDMAAILDSLARADAIVLATPVYFYSMDAQMKTFIDRVYARYTELTGKEFYFIVTAADGNEKNLVRTVDGLSGFTDCLDGAKVRGVVYGAGAWAKGDITSSAAMQRAFDFGKNL